MFAEQHVIDWWARCSDEQRAQFYRSAQEYRVDPDTLKLLAATRLPYGPVGTRWESDPEYAWSWPQEIRDFVLTRGTTIIRDLHEEVTRRGYTAEIDESRSALPTCFIESITTPSVTALDNGEQIEDEEYKLVNIRVTYLGLTPTGQLDIRWVGDDGSQKYEPDPGKENAAELADRIFGK